MIVPVNDCFHIPSRLIEARDSLVRELLYPPGAVPAGARNLTRGYKGVVGIGIGRGKKGAHDDGYGITVYLSNDSVARMLQPLYKGKGGCFQVVGEARACVETPDELPDVMSSRRPARAVEVSIGHYLGETGTIGCLVRGKTDSPDELPLILSCSHILARCGECEKEDKIIKPGRLDGGSSDDTVALLERWEPPELKSRGNTMDAAIARLIRNRLTAEDINRALSISKIRGVADLKDLRGEGTEPRVHKLGRTTGLTHGMIDSVDVTVPVNYFDEELGFDGQFVIRPESDDALAQPSGSVFADCGDSGAVVCDEHGRAVGLLIAAYMNAGWGIATPIIPVLNALAVDLYV